MPSAEFFQRLDFMSSVRTTRIEFPTQPLQLELDIVPMSIAKELTSHVSLISCLGQVALDDRTLHSIQEGFPSAPVVP